MNDKQKYKVSTPRGNCFVTESSEIIAIDEAIKRKYGKRCSFKLSGIENLGDRLRYTGVVSGRFKDGLYRVMGIQVSVKPYSDGKEKGD